MELERWLQWRLWLASDSVSWILCIGGIITKIAFYFGINFNNLASIPPSLLDENLFKNSKQFKKVEEVWLWKYEEGERVNKDLAQDLEDIEQIGNLGLEGFSLG